MPDLTTETVVSEAAAPKARRGPRGKVIIYGTWCKGCGLCVEFCPTGVLKLDADDRPYPAFPEKCTACHWCDTHCPDLAIVVRPLDGVRPLDNARFLNGTPPFEGARPVDGGRPPEGRRGQGV